MDKTQREKGIAQPLLLLVVGVGVLLFASSLIPITRTYNDGKSDVAGVYMAKAENFRPAMVTEEDINIATAGGMTAVVNKRVGALSNFPLSVDPTTRQLTVTTPAGSKVVAVLPQQAVDNMLASKVMTDIVGERVDNELASIPNLVKLEEKDGILVYKVKGTKTHKLLGFIPIKTGVTAFVSAENGQVVESTDSFLGRILNRIAL